MLPQTFVSLLHHRTRLRSVSLPGRKETGLAHMPTLISLMSPIVTLWLPSISWLGRQLHPALGLTPKSLSHSHIWRLLQRLSQWTKRCPPACQPITAALGLKYLPYLCMTLTFDALRNLMAARTPEGVCVHVCSAAQLCLTLCDPTDCSLPGFSVHGIY